MSMDSGALDVRIVELQFNNRQFEDGVQESMGTLERLKSALKLDGASNGLEEVNKASKSFSLDGVASAIDTVNDRFSTMGIVGMTVIQDLTNMAVNFGKRLITAIPNQIISGGKRRALNLEQARFQLSGILKDTEKVEQVMDSVSKSVKGTRFGLDEAAVVAAQLAASNVEAGESMLQTLKGIAGAASMTGNRSFADIGNIFATVASNGKLMTMQLRQFAAAGLNVSATLAKVYGTTEEEINEAVKKGQISFEMFAQAMSEEFGEVSQKANETFTGAFANTKAALSRIGADVAGPTYEAIRKVLVKLIPLIDNIHEFLKPAINAINAGIEAAGSFVEKVLEGFNAIFGSIKPAVEPIEEAVEQVEKVAHTAEEIDEMARQVIRGVYGNGYERKKNLAELDYSWAQVQNRVNEILGCSVRHTEEEDIVIEKTQEHTEANEELADSQEEVNEKTEESDSIAGKFKRTIKGISSAVDIIRRALGKVGKLVLLPIITKVLPSALSIILGLTAKLGDGLTFLNSKLEEAEILEQIVGWFKKITREGGKVDRFVTSLKNSFSTLFTNLKAWLKDSWENFKAFTKTIGELEGVKHLKESFKGLKDDIVGVLSSIADNATSLFDQLGADSGFLSALKFETLGDAIDFVADKLADFIDFIRSAGQWVADLLPDDIDVSGVKDTIDSLIEKGKTLFDTFKSDSASVVGDFFQRVKDAVPSFEDIGKTVGNIGETIGKGIGNIASNVEISEETFKRILNVAIIGTLAYFVFHLSWLVDRLATIPANISQTFKNLNGVLTAQKYSTLADVATKIANAIGIIALSMLALSTLVDQEDLAKVTVDLIAIILAIAFLIDRLGEVKKANAGTTVIDRFTTILQKLAQKVGVVILAIGFATALAILVGILKSLADIDYLTFLVSFQKLSMVVAALLGVLYLTEMLISAFKVSNSDLVEAGKAFVLLAVAIGIMTICLNALSKIPADKSANALDSLLGMAGTLLLMIGLLQVLSYFTNADKNATGILSFAAAMILMSVAIALLVPPFTAISKIPVEDVKKATIAIAVLALAMGVASAIASVDASLKAVAVILALALAIVVLVPALVALGAAAKSAIKGVGVILIIVAALELLATIATALGLQPALLVIAAVIGALSLLGFSFLSLAKGVALLTVVLGPFASAFIGFCKTIAGSGEAISGMLATLLSSFITAFLGLKGEVVKAVAMLIVAICEAIDKATPAILHTLTLLLIRLIVWAQQALVVLSDVIIKLIIGLINLVSKAIVDNAGIFFEALANLGQALRYLIFAGISQIVSETLGRIPIVGGQIRNLLAEWNDRAASGINPDPFQQNSEEALMGMIDGFQSKSDEAEGAVNGILENIGITGGEAISNSAQQIVSNFDLSGLPFTAGTSVDGVTNLIRDSIPMGADLSTDLSNSINGNFDPRLDVDMSTSVDGMISSLTGSSGEAGGAAALLSGAVESNAALDPATFEGLSVDGISSYISGITDSAGAAGDAAGSLGETAVGEIQELIPDYGSAGSSSTTEYAKGIKSKESLSQLAGTNIAQYGAAGADSKRGSFKIAGAYAGQGFVNGLRSKLGASTSAGSAIAAAALSAAKRTLDEHSPSRAFGLVGSYGGEGFVDGLVEWVGKAAKAASEMADGALDSAQKSMANADSLFMPTSEYNPVVRPVMDLSNIQNGQSTIGGLLNDRTMQLAGQASVSLSADKVSFEETLAKTVESAITRAMDNFKEREDLQPYEIVVPINYNGREVSRVTAPFIRADLNKRDMHDLRKVGVV